MQQGSPEWLQARCGSLGASSVHEALAKTKSGWSASRANVMARLIAERLTGSPAETYTNGAMAYGSEMEPEARAAYAFMHDVDVDEVGLIRHPTIAGSHASPDGMVSTDGLVEIKCPNTATHIDTLLTETVPAKYITQMMWQMECTDRQWCDFVSYDARMPDDMQLFVKRVHADTKRLKALRTDVEIFLEELEAKIDRLRNLKADAQPTENAA